MENVRVAERHLDTEAEYNKIIGKLRVTVATNLRQEQGRRDKKVAGLEKTMSIFKPLREEYADEYIADLAKEFALDPMELLTPRYPLVSVMEVFSGAKEKFSNKIVTQAELLDVAQKLNFFNKPFKAVKIFDVNPNMPNNYMVLFSILGILELFEFCKDRRQGKELYDDIYKDHKDAMDKALDLAVKT